MIGEKKENPRYASQTKHNQLHRENLGLGLAKGTKERWKSYAEKKGMTLTQYITQLIITDNPEEAEALAASSAKARKKIINNSEEGDHHGSN